MSLDGQKRDAFNDGWQDAFAEVRKSVGLGEWNEQTRDRWMKRAVSARSCTRHTCPHLRLVTSYQAGYISALRSGRSQCYANECQVELDRCESEALFGGAQPLKQTSFIKELVFSSANGLFFLVFLLGQLLDRLSPTLTLFLLLAGLRVALWLWTRKRVGK